MMRGIHCIQEDELYKSATITYVCNSLTQTLWLLSHLIRQGAKCIRQHCSAVYVYRDGDGCLYIILQWKTAAGVLQSGNWANRTVEAK